MKWGPHNLQDTILDDVRYPVVSAIENRCSTLCNPKENSLTPLKVSANQSRYGSNIPSKRMEVDFLDAIKDKDHFFNARRSGAVKG